MTDDDKALVERLLDFLHSDDVFAVDWTDIAAAAESIEALSAENERLREAMEGVSAIWRRHKYSGDFDLWLNAHIRAALGETK